MNTAEPDKNQQPLPRERGARRGQAWGSEIDIDPQTPLANSNAELRAIVEVALAAEETPPLVGVCGGDIWRAVGAAPNTKQRLRSGKAHGAHIDVIHIQDNHDHYWGCAHLVLRQRFWLGQVVAVMNSEWLGRWRVAPAAHPGDGRLHEVATTPKFGVGQRLLARRRLRTGDHLPHPGLRTRRITEAEFEFARPIGLWLDGTYVKRTQSLQVEIIPAAVQIAF